MTSGIDHSFRSSTHGLNEPSDCLLRNVEKNSHSRDRAAISYSIQFISGLCRRFKSISKVSGSNKSVLPLCCRPVSCSPGSVFLGAHCNLAISCRIHSGSTYVEPSRNCWNRSAQLKHSNSLISLGFIKPRHTESAKKSNFLVWRTMYNESSITCVVFVFKSVHVVSK